MRFLLIIIVIFFVSSITSCYYDKADLLYPNNAANACDTSVVPKFATDIAPIMNTNCNLSGCHNTASASSGVILDTYAGVKTQVTNGRLIASTNPASGTMPKNAAPLASCTITKIKQWINSGSPNN